MGLFFKMTTGDLYDVSRLMLSPIVTRHAALQLHNNNTEFVWWWWVASYPLSCNSQLMLRLRWRLRLSWAVTTVTLPFNLSG